MILLSLVGGSIGGWLRSVIVAIVRSVPHSSREVPREYYRFPPF